MYDKFILDRSKAQQIGILDHEFSQISYIFTHHFLAKRHVERFFTPTLIGQYIIKNFALISLGLFIAFSQWN